MDSIILNKLHREEVNILDEIVKICDENNLQYFLIGGTLLGAVRHKGFIPWDDDLDIAMPRDDYNKFIKIVRSNESEKYKIDYYKNNKNYWLPFIKMRNIKTTYQEKAQINYKGQNGIWVDIFPLDNGVEDEEVLLKKQERLKKLNACLQVKNLRKIEKNDPLKKKIEIVLIKLIPNNLVHNIINKVMSFNKDNNSLYFVNFGSQYGVKKQTHLKEKYIPATSIQFEGKLYKAPRDYDYVLKKIYGENYMELPPVEKRITHNPIKIRFENEEEVEFQEDQ